VAYDLIHDEPKPLQWLVMTRTVTVDECDWLPRDVDCGERVIRFTGATYGCITPYGTPIQLEEEGPFYEVPSVAVCPAKEAL
jgi:hypothetical protein